MFDLNVADIASWPYDNVLAAGSVVRKLAPAAEKVLLNQSTTAAVPEPATWVSLIVGFAVVGIVARARFRKTAEA